jgi:hypothetical protein
MRLNNGGVGFDTPPESRTCLARRRHRPPSQPRPELKSFRALSFCSLQPQRRHSRRRQTVSISRNMPINVILGAQWGKSASPPLPGMRSASVPRRYRLVVTILTKSYRRRRRECSIRIQYGAMSGHQLTILCFQKGKLVDIQSREAQLCCRAAVSSTRHSSRQRLPRFLRNRKHPG